MRKKIRFSKKEKKAKAKLATRLEENFEVKKEEDRVLKKVTLPRVITVRALAEKLSLPIGKVIETLLKNGLSATINESVDFETAAIIGDDLGFDVEREIEEKKEEKIAKKGERRPLVVVVLGHVDHGKTKLLDAIRQTDVVATESGGITQHIGAYQIKLKAQSSKRKTEEKTITFLDTPGHEAFSALRARGANLTDIAILVVAADEGVKPQTLEALSHARAAGVPIIVALNKIDKPEADPEKVKRELSEIDLLPEEWGGKTIIVPVSAKQNMGIDELLEMIILQAELLDLKAEKNVFAGGGVIEAHMEKGKGPLATLLIQKGTLHLGDFVVCGQTFGKVRLMEDFRGKKMKEAFPSDPVRIAGLKTLPDFGETFTVVPDEKTARELSLKTQEAKGAKSISKILGIHEISQAIKEGKVKEVPLIIKADVKGSLEAIVASLSQFVSKDLTLKVIEKGVGDVSESDVNLAQTTGALILAFRVEIPPQVLKLALTSKVKISRYEIIYELIEDVTKAMEGLLEPEIEEIPLGKLEVLKVFFKTREGGIVGGKVKGEKIFPKVKARVKRGDTLLGKIEISTLKIGPQEVDEASPGNEAGVSYQGEIKIKPGDILEFFREETKLKKLEKVEYS